MTLAIGPCGVLSPITFRCNLKITGVAKGKVKPKGKSRKQKSTTRKLVGEVMLELKSVTIQTNYHTTVSS
jgi:fatty acid-binding protein DegV